MVNNRHTIDLQELCLEEPPQVVRCGVGRHGDRPEEHYLLEDLWALHRYGYGVDMVVEGQDLEIETGDLTLFRPGVALTYRYRKLKNEHLFALFQFPMGTASSGAVPMHHRPSTEQSLRLKEVFSKVVEGQGSPRSSSALWELLWMLLERRDSTSSPEERVAA